MLLHHELVTAPDAAPTRAVVFLHGILGTGGNLRSHAKRFVQSQPQTAAVLMDLRAHGQSLGVDGPDTIENTARDVLQTARTFGFPLFGVVGHSFGGKIAIAMAAQIPELEHVLTLDSGPGTRIEARGSEQTVQVVEMLRELRGPWAKRDDFVRDVGTYGFNAGLASWLGMNLIKRDEGFVFALELTRIQALLDDYFRVDLWPVVEKAAAAKSGPRFHLVIGAKSRVYDEEERAKALALEASSDGWVTVDVLNTGHWIHVDDPQGVAEALQKHLR